LVQADGVNSWDGTGLFTAVGNVTLRYRDAVITADAMRYDAEAGTILFEGNVVYVEGQQELAGARLHYDLNTATAVFEDLDAIVYAQGVQGPMFVRGQRVESTSDVVVIQGGFLTTCECQEDRPPAYHFTAREIEIYPGDRLVVRGVTFYDHGVPLLYLPWLTLSLREDRNHFDLPQIGYSERTGWYIKTAYNYVLASGLYGAILLDWYQYLGFGGGVRHTYLHDGSGRGTVLVYGVANRSGGSDGTLEWEREWNLERWRLATQLGYDVSTEPGGVNEEEIRGELRFEQTAGPGAARGDLEYRIVTGKDPLERFAGSVELRRPVGAQWEFYGRADGFEHDKPDEPLRRWLGYTAELRQATADYTLSIRVHQQVHPDLRDEKKSPNVPWTHVSRLPEITLETRAVAGISLRAGVARLKEEPDGIAAWRGEAQARARRSWPVGQRAVLTSSTSLLGQLYSTEDRQLSFESRTGFNWQFSQPMGLTLQHTYREAWGHSPFRFDRVSPASTLAGRLNWRSAALTATLSTSYDLLDQEWNPLTISGIARLSANASLRAAAQYETAVRRWQRVAATLDWQPAEGWLVRLGGQYDVPTAQMERVDVQWEWSVRGGWKGGLTTIYHPANQTFTRLEVFFAHDAECREIRLSYDHERREVWLQYQIAAFPLSRVAVGASEDKLLFESDALSEFLGIE